MARTPTPAAAAADAKAAAAATAPAGDATEPLPANEPTVAAADVVDVDQGDLIEARVLIAFDEHEPNDVVSFCSEDLDTLEREGKVDADPRAVAYAKSLLNG